MQLRITQQRQLSTVAANVNTAGIAVWVKYENGLPCCVRMLPYQFVFELKIAIKLLLHNKLSGVDVDDLSLSYDDHSEEIDSGMEIAELTGGLRSTAPLHCRRRSGSNHGTSSAQSSRQQRWLKMNAIASATCSSYFRWNDALRDVFSPMIPYTQPVKSIPPAVMENLQTYLENVSKCSSMVIPSTGTAPVAHYIIPIFACACQLFDGQVTIETKEYLRGISLKAKCQVEYVLSRGNRRILIFQEIASSIDYGLSQSLVGCEIAAESGRHTKIYSIVTNYYRWVFVRSLDQRVEIDNCSLAVRGSVPTMESLVEVTGKIYAMLSDEE